MNHGRLGYISQSSLRLPPDILDQFGLREGNVIFGVYYPRNKSDPEHQRATVDDDFMLTPLFPRLWDRAGCFIVRIKHEPHTFATIARFLAKENLSIYCSECTRSGYRYATWNLHVVVTGLPERLSYDEERSGYPKAIQYLEAAKAKLLKTCRNVLFVDSKEPDLEDPVKLLHLSALSYFAHQYNEVRKDRLPFHPFRLCVGAKGFLRDDQQGFAKVLNRIKELHHRDLRNSVFFVEADRRNYNMRLAVFAGPRSNNIFVARARYTSSGDWNCFRGLLARIATSLPRNCNIWKCSNEKLEVEGEYEKGIIKMVLEVGDTGTSQKIKVLQIKQSFTQQDPGFAPCTKVEEPVVEPATLTYCRKRIGRDFVREQEEKPIVFISYHHGQRRKAEDVCEWLKKQGVQGWLDNKDLTRGEWAEQIKRALTRTDEFILLWTRQCRKSEWVTTEWNVAHCFGIPITILMINAREHSLPEQLREMHAISFNDKKRRREALDTVVERMKRLAWTDRD